MHNTYWMHDSIVVLRCTTKRYCDAWKRKTHLVELLKLAITLLGSRLGCLTRIQNAMLGFCVSDCKNVPERKKMV